MADAQNLPQPIFPSQDSGSPPDVVGSSATSMSGSVLPTPLPPTSASDQPIPSSTPSVSSAGPVSSRLMQNLQSVNPMPFQDSVTLPAQDQGAGQTSLGQSSVVSDTAVPQESIGFASVPQQAGVAVTGVAQSTFSTSSSSPSMTTTTTDASSPKPAKTGGVFAQLRESKIALVGIGVLLLSLLGGGGYFLYTQFLSPEPVSIVNTPDGSGSPAVTAPKTTLTYWGLWEPEEVMAPLIAEYESQNPTVQIEYTQQKVDQYRQRVQAAIRDGSGPDIFRFHNTWIPMIQNDIVPAPTAVLSAGMIEQDFYPIMSRDLVINDEVYGVPLMYEGMALLYNQNILEAAAAQPPQDWNQVRALATQLTIRNGERIERAGIALGTAGNVDHFSDVLGLMLLQNSANPADPTSINVQHALEFYTIFARSDRVWDETFPASVDAFANEQVAMIFAPSWRIFEIQRANPNINIGVVRTPQLGGTTVTWGTYWAEGVSANSKNTQEAWKFLAFLSQEEQLRTFHDEGASYRSFGELYPRVEMAKNLLSNSLIQPYLEDALYARSWYLASQTHDEGLNDQMIQYYADAVNASNESGNVARSLQGIAPGIQQVLSRYAIPAPILE